MTTDPRRRAAVCILRVESDGERPLITVTTNDDLDRRLHSVRPASLRRFTDVDAVLVATDEFLRSVVEREGA
jgi:hypothetical protein